MSSSYFVVNIVTSVDKLFCNTTDNGLDYLFPAGEHLGGIHSCPSSTAEMRENVDRVLQYMAANRIRMHHTNAKGTWRIDEQVWLLDLIMDQLLFIPVRFSLHTSIQLFGIISGGMTDREILHLAYRLFIMNWNKAIINGISYS